MSGATRGIQNQLDALSNEKVLDGYSLINDYTAVNADGAVSAASDLYRTGCSGILEIQ